MKLRYQMRGLGIGIVVTALLMGVTGREKLPLSDAEIRAKALSLGMVDAESRRLTDVGSSPASETAQPVQPSESEAETEPEGAVSSEEEPVDAPSVPESDESGTDDLPGSSVTVVIEAGTTSYQVSRMLAEAGLVENAVEFDNYLCDNGYSTNIAAGTYEIWPGTSQEEIINLITKKR